MNQWRSQRFRTPSQTFSTSTTPPRPRLSLGTAWAQITGQPWGIWGFRGVLHRDSYITKLKLITEINTSSTTATRGWTITSIPWVSRLMSDDKMVQFALLFNCANSAAMTDDEVCKVDPPKKKTLSLCYLSLKIYHSSKTKKKRKDRKNVTKTVVCSKKIIEKKNQSFWTLKRKHYCQKKLNFIHSLIWSQERLIATPAWTEKKRKQFGFDDRKPKKKFAPPNFIARRKAGKIQPKSHSTTRLSRLRRSGFKDPDA